MKLIFVSFAFSFIFLTSCIKEVVHEKEQAKRTIIVYMAADNDLSDDAYADIYEMQNVIQEKDINLVVFLDPADDIPHILEIGYVGSRRVKNYPELNSASASQMEHVLKDVITMYPAISYGLILWSHGTSWLPAGNMLKSFGNDNGRQMDITDLAAALPVRFDFILLDACLMGSVEVVYELRHKTDFILASSAEIIYSGFPYEQIIPELFKDELDLKKVAASYFNYYDSFKDLYRSATISLIDTRELNKLAMVTSQIINDRVFDFSAFDRVWVQRLDVYEALYTFDFLDFIEKAFPDADNDLLRKQLDNVVIYKAHTPEFIGIFTIESYCGLSCYIPDVTHGLKNFYQQLDWCKDSGFCQLFW